MERKSYYIKYFELTGSFNFSVRLYDSLLALDQQPGFCRDNAFEFFPQKTVLVRDIVGTTHCDYQDSKNWFVFFHNLKRGQSIEALKYYVRFHTAHDGSLNGDYGLIEYKGKYWINGGNHRICIAKVVGIETIEIDVVHYLPQ